MRIKQKIPKVGLSGINIVKENYFFLFSLLRPITAPETKSNEAPPSIGIAEGPFALGGVSGNVLG